MAFSKLKKQKYPPRHWALVGYPAGGKSTFAARMRGPHVVIDADQRFIEVAHLVHDEIYPVSPIAHEHSDPHAISKRLNENMPEVMASPAPIGTIIIDSLTAIMAPRVTAAMVAKDAGEIPSLGAAWKDKALAMRELQDAVTKWGTDTLWIYHRHDARDASGGARQNATTVSASELVRLTRSINMQLEIVTEAKTKQRGIKIMWARRGRDGAVLWDDSGTWKDMPERIEAAAYDGLTPEDMDRIENSAPEVFASHEIAIEWAMNQGAFENQVHAQNAYKKLMREKSPANLRAFTPLWVSEVQSRVTDANKQKAG